MVAQKTICSVSVDLDAVACYWTIHALPGEVPVGARHTILRRCLPRFAALFAEADVKATFFVVGRDLLEDDEGRRLLSRLAADGHELANHSFTHPYDLVRRSRPAMADEIDRAHDQIGTVAGTAPVGFRAPGYGVSAPLLDLLGERSYRYDSSVFPSVAYYGAKAVVMAAMRIVGRPSGSVLGTPRVLSAPTAPYHPRAGDPFSRGDLRIWELPIAVTPGLRLPVLGTSLVTAPAWLRGRLLAAVSGTRHFNLELHGIDLCDAADDGIPSQLVARQPDLRRPLAAKTDALRSALFAIRESGAVFRTLASATSALDE